MSITNKAYTTKDKVEQYLKRTISDNIDLYIITAQQYIDKYTGRSFKSGTAGETRLYSGNNDRALIIDPVLTVTKLEIDYGSGFEEEDDYELLPLNTTPKVKVYLNNGYFPKGVANVKITGTFGWSATVPDDISYVATVLTAGMIDGKSANEIISEKIGEYQVSYEGGETEGINDIKSILNLYKKLF